MRCRHGVSRLVDVHSAGLPPHVVARATQGIANGGDANRRRDLLDEPGESISWSARCHGPRPLTDGASATPGPTVTGSANCPEQFSKGASDGSSNSPPPSGSSTAAYQRPSVPMIASK